MTVPEGCGFAFQRGVSVAEQEDVTYGVGGRKCAVDTTYGLGGLALGDGSAALGKSPFVCKLAN